MHSPGATVRVTLTADTANGNPGDRVRKNARVSRWVALLRAVNVGARTYPMAQVRAALTTAGYADVETHTQTGNICLSAAARSGPKLESALETVFAADRGFRVATFVLRPADLAELADATSELSGLHRPEFGHYVSVLRSAAEPNLVDRLEDLRRPGELVVVRGRAVHLLYDVPYHQAKTSNATIEKVTGAEATNRNARVIAALAAKWGAT